MFAVVFAVSVSSTNAVALLLRREHVILQDNDTRLKMEMRKVKAHRLNTTRPKK